MRPNLDADALQRVVISQQCEIERLEHVVYLLRQQIRELTEQPASRKAVPAWPTPAVWEPMQPTGDM